MWITKSHPYEPELQERILRLTLELQKANKGIARLRRKNERLDEKLERAQQRLKGVPTCEQCEGTGFQHCGYYQDDPGWKEECGMCDGTGYELEGGERHETK